MLTESDVEQKFIYSFLTDVSPEGLGFFPDNIQTKRDIRKIVIGKGGSKKLYYPDYVVVLDGLPAMIVEAKTPEDQDVDEAFREARLYATELNALYSPQVNPCSIVIATNGRRLMAGKWDSQNSLVDISLEENSVANDDYITLLELAGYATLSKEVSKIRLALKGSAKYTKPVFALGGKSIINETVGENDFGSNVSLEYQSLFNPDTIQEKAGIAQNAYISSKRRESHVAPIDRVFRATIPPHQRDSNTLKDSENPDELLQALGNFENRDKLKNEMCLLVGGVGAGKSMFTEYLRLRALPAGLVSATEWINVDLNNAPLSKDRVYTWLQERVVEHIKAKNPQTDFASLDFLKRLYADELAEVSRGRAALFPPESMQFLEIVADEMRKLQQDTTKTLTNLISLLYEKEGRLLVLVLDNCDKRTRDDQLLMFEVAAWIKSTFRCLIFLPLRDTTYDLYSDKPPLDTVVKDLVFRIEAPLLEKVLSARMSFLLRSVKSNQESFKFSTSNGIIMKCDRNEVVNFMKCVVTTLFQDRNFKPIIKGLAGRNIRRGLEIVLDFCKSGHISADQILKMRLSNGEYRLPPHLVYRVLMKGNRRYFSDEKSKLINLFHSYPMDDLPDPFVRLDILAWLRDKFGVKGPNNTKGYHKVESVVQAMQGIGHKRDRVLSEINALIEAELVMPEALTDSAELSDLVVITASGFTHLDIIRSVEYLSTVSEDTHFRDSDVAKKIADNLVGRGYFKPDTKEASLSNSIELVNYMSNYSEDYFFKNESVSDSFDWAHDKKIAGLKQYLQSKEAKNDKILSASSLEENYRRGSEHMAQVGAIKEYGLFVELSNGVSCLVHKSNFGVSAKKVFDSIEEGDDVMIKIIEFNKPNQRLNASLIDF